MVVLLFLTDAHHPSFVAGLVVGALTIQVSATASARSCPRTTRADIAGHTEHAQCFAVRVFPGLARPEILFMTVLLVWSLTTLVKNL